MVKKRKVLICVIGLFERDVRRARFKENLFQAHYRKPLKAERKSHHQPEKSSRSLQRSKDKTLGRNPGI